MTPNRPNILYIHSHDTGRYVQPYGHAIETPRIQRLAEEGVLFRQNFCVNPTCSPSRAALLTGCYPHENGMLGLAHRGRFALHDYGQHIVNVLRPHGYVSALVGVQHVAVDQDERKAWQVIGYDEGFNDEQQHERASAWLDDAPPKPFFLSVGFPQTHRDFPPLDDCRDDPRYCLPPAPLPDTPETRQDMARYKESARTLDVKIGTVLDALERNGLAENTLVICTTDHGIAFPRMKCNLHDSGTGVMLILRGPGGLSGGGVVDAMTSHLDVYPTVCELLGIDPPTWLRGKSLLPVVRGEVDELHEELFAEVNWHAAYDPQRSVRTMRWKYIKRYDGRNRPVLPNCDDGESKSLWLEHGWQGAEAPEESLFDLVFDPNETNNLVDNEACEAALVDMRARLDRWMRETNDPLLDGPMQAPPGAVLNDPDGLSPQDPPMTR